MREAACYRLADISSATKYLPYRPLEAYFVGTIAHDGVET